MKNLFFPLLVFFSSCATQKTFPDKDVCFILYDLKKDRIEEVYNEDRCHERLPAASTFKLALSVMAFDSGIFKDENIPVFKWNGKPTPLDNWNRDQTPFTWMKDSAVWVSQEITPRITMEKIQQYLSDFEYGNQDMTGGIKYAWLTPAPVITEPMQNSLKISGFEQVKFLKRLWTSQLKSSEQSQVMTRKIMVRDDSKKGTLLGKTGSGFMDDKYQFRIGWYVAHLQKEESEYIVVLNFTDTKPEAPGGFGGREAKEMVFDVLSEKNLW